MRKLALCLALFFTIIGAAVSQSYKLDNTSSHLSIFGTSTLHDWEIKAEKLIGSMLISASDTEFEISSLSFEVEVKSLKSGKGAMDNNTYDALNEEKYSLIDYQLSSAEVTEKSADIISLNTKGNLTIAGTKKMISMPVKATMSNSNISYQGQITFNMSEYGIDPPTALLGTIKTGDEITIKYTVTFIK